MNRKKLETMEEVQKWVFSMMEKEEKIIYRGQGNSKWDLDSTFARENKKHLKTKINNETLFKLTTHYFDAKNEYLKRELGETDDLLLLGKMQHYGNSTPLIDFTEFAASFSPGESNDTTPKFMKIFYEEDKVDEHKEQIDLKNISFEEISIFKFNTKQKLGRSISQKSIFIFDNLNIKQKIKSVQIKWDLNTEIIQWIGQLGINDHSLFPDEVGIFKNFDLFSKHKYFFEGLKISISKQWEEAIEKYQKKVELDPNFAPTYNNLNLALKKRKLVYILVVYKICISYQLAQNLIRSLFIKNKTKWYRSRFVQTIKNIIYQWKM